MSGKAASANVGAGVVLGLVAILFFAITYTTGIAAGYVRGIDDAECAAQCDGDWVRRGERCGCIGEGP